MVATLTSADRQAIWSKFMEEASRLWLGVNLSKLELRAAVDATDNWINSNAASFNTALPVEARTNLTTKQKWELFLLVARRRWEVE